MLQSLINRTLDDAQSASDSVTGGISRIAACADAAQSSAAGAAIGLRAVCRRSRHACRVAALGGHCGGAHTAIAAVITLVIRKKRAKAAKRAQ